MTAWRSTTERKDATLEATLHQGGEEPLDHIEPKKLRSA